MSNDPRLRRPDLVPGALDAGRPVTEGGKHVPPFKVKTVDAVGCGDAFVAGLLCQLVVNANWRDQLSVARMRDILHYANAVGALTATKQGVIPALPTANQVNEFLTQQH